MKTLILILLFATPAMAQDLPFAKGDYVVQAQLLDPFTGRVSPNPLPKSDWACFRIETITPNDLWMYLESGYFDMRQPGLDVPPEYAPPARSPIGTGTGQSASDGIWTACLPPDPTGFTTVSVTCDLARLYVKVPDCKGRPLPP